MLMWLVAGAFAQDLPPDVRALPAAAPLPIADSWAALEALEEKRLQRAPYPPLALGVAALAEVGTGAVAAFAFERPALGVGLVAGGVLHGSTAALTIETASRRKTAYRAQLAETDLTRPGAASAVAEHWRLAAERDARANAFGLGANVGAILAGGLLVAAGCMPLVDDYTGIACAPDAGVGIASAGVTGAIFHGLRWRSSVRLSNDLALVDAQIPTTLDLAEESEVVR